MSHLLCVCGMHVHVFMFSCMCLHVGRVVHACGDQRLMLGVHHSYLEAGSLTYTHVQGIDKPSYLACSGDPVSTSYDLGLHVNRHAQLTSI